MNHTGGLNQQLQLQIESIRRIQSMLAGEYVRRFSSVSDDQLRRFENIAYKLMKQRPDSVYGALWINAEGEMVARSFEAGSNGN